MEASARITERKHPCFQRSSPPAGHSDHRFGHVPSCGGNRSAACNQRRGRCSITARASVGENGKPILSSVAVSLPVALRDHEGAMLAGALRHSATRLEYVCFTGRSPTDAVRWPSSGWISGTVADLCLVCQSMTIPPPVVEAAADRLVQGVSDTAFLLSDAAREYQAALDEIAALLHQEERLQTRRMAMTIVANALIFHASLAGHGGRLAYIRSVHQIRGTEGYLSRAMLLNEWQNILAINYWPIFDIARQIVELLPAPIVRAILERLADTADFCPGKWPYSIS